MIKRHFLIQFILPCLIAGSGWADTITWVGQTPNNDMTNPANWNPGMVPGSGDTAVFNSKMHGVATNPSVLGAPFSVSNFSFPFNAAPFHFIFSNGALEFSGAGITGAKLNPTISVLNVNNGSFPGDLVSFTGGMGTSGSAILTSSNSGTLTGVASGTGMGSINSNFHASGDFLIANGGSITASNTGYDSAIGTGNNGVANTGASQLKFDQSFTAENNVTVSISNSGTFSGTNSLQGDAVAIVNGSQFITSGAFQTGDDFSCTMHNTGNDSSLGVGLSNIGQLNAAQMMLQTAGTVGDNCSITLSNTGINSSYPISFPNFIGYLNDEQFFAGGAFGAGDNFNLTVSNTGTDTSGGNGGSQVAVINSNSGTTGNQILFKQGCSLGDEATISASNSGTYNGTNSNGGSNVAGMNLQQIAIGDSSSPGSSNLIAGDHFSLSASNMGVDSSYGAGGNAVGTVSSDQITIYSQATLGSNANITISNSGNVSDQATTTYVNVGSVGGGQLNCVSSFSAANDFSLNISNSGTNTGSGIGGYFIGDIINGQQAAFQDGLVIGNNASITISNEGTNTSSTTSYNQVGSFMGYGKQLLAKDQFLTGDGFQLEITNSGFDASTGTGGNFVGFINNNTLDISASQLHLENGGTVGNKASITLSNIGTYQGSNTTSGNTVGVLAEQQFYSATDFQAGNNFILTLSNSGVDQSSGQNGNNIGTVGSSQVEFGGTCTLGNQATIMLSNSGINHDTTGALNDIGVVNGSQMLAFGDFSAGTGLSIRAENLMINEGDPDNFVGQLNSCQVEFVQGCTLHDGTTIHAFNTGSVGCSQILFDEGFTVASGKVSLEAINLGTVGSYGIDVLGSSLGGNADIVLGNSSLNVSTILPTFTIASLEGDSTSVVQSLPQLIIQTDASTKAEFSGVIQDYFANSSSLMKTGTGIQKLSGINTYTGLTTVQEGVLVLNGSLAGDVLTNPLGTLKGNGTIGGTFINTGVISPGESIGTMTVGNYINNNGTYTVEVNGLGESDLIHATGSATLNGGTVLVSSVDGTFSFGQPYTIVTADAGVTGAFTNATSLAFINPSLTYDPNNVYLTLQAALKNAAEKCNQLGVATNLDNILNPSATQSLLIATIANLPLTDAQRALESLSGFQYTQDVLLTEISTSRLLRRLYDPLRSLVSECKDSCNNWTSWIETGYGHTNTGHSLHCDSYQVTTGIQKSLYSNLTLGVAGSYEHDHVKYRDGKADRDTGFASIYGLYRPNQFYGLFNLVYGYSSNKLKRTIEAGNVQYKSHSRPDCNIFTFYGEAGFDVACERALIQPFLGLQLGKNWRGRIKENDASGWGLTINNYDWTSARSRLGLHLATCHLFDTIDTSFDIAWNQRLSSSKNSTVGRFKEFGDSFAICGNRLDNYSVDYALNFTTCFCEDLRGYFELDGEWWKHANTFNVLGGIEYSW